MRVLRAFGPYAIISMTAILVILPLALRDGTPAFLHDWLWPAGRDQIAAFSFAGLWAWDTSGAGEPLAYPFPWLPNLLEGAAAYAFGPHLSLSLILAVYSVIAGAGMFRFCTSVGSPPFGALAGAALYMGSPVVLNELHAGHLFFLFSLAILPWTLLSARSFDLRSLIATGSLVGIGSAQQQFFFYTLLLIVIIRGSLTKRFALWYAGVTIVALVVTAPQWLEVLTLERGSLAAFIPFIHWEYAQSAPPSLALRMLGYTAGYDTALPVDISLALWPITGVAVLNALVARNRLGYASLAGIAIGVSCAAGLYGPLAAAFAVAFERFTAFAFFRELYGFQAITLFSICIAISLLPPMRWGRTVLQTMWTLTVVVACVIACYSTVNIPVLRAFTPPKALSEGYRFMQIPAIYPVKAADENSAGLSPYILPIGSHPSGSFSTVEFPSAYFSSVAESDATDRASILERDAICCVFDTGLQPGLANDVESSLSGLANASAVNRSIVAQAAPEMVVRPFAVEAGTLESQYKDAMRLEPLDTAEPRAFTPSTVLDPRTGWGRLGLWPNLPPWAYAAPISAFTFQHAIALENPPGTVVVGNADGRVRSTLCRVVAQLSEHWRALNCRANAELYGRVPIVFSRVYDSDITLSRERSTGSRGRVTLSVSTPIAVYGTIDAGTGGAVILRQSFDRGWNITVPGRHISIDGYANGWILSKSVHGPFIAWYQPGVERLIAVLVSASILALGVVLALKSSSADCKTASTVSS